MGSSRAGRPSVRGGNEASCPCHDFRLVCLLPLWLTEQAAGPVPRSPLPPAPRSALTEWKWFRRQKVGCSVRRRGLAEEGRSCRCSYRGSGSPYFRPRACCVCLHGTVGDRSRATSHQPRACPRLCKRELHLSSQTGRDLCFPQWPHSPAVPSQWGPFPPHPDPRLTCAGVC